MAKETANEHDTLTRKVSERVPQRTEAPYPGMVWIPGGTFMMGSDKHYPEEAPAHEVTVDGFWMDIHTVTNEEFRRFVDATKYVTSAERPPNAEDYPGAKPGIARACVGRFSETAPTSRSSRLLSMVDLCSRRQLATSRRTGELFEGESETSRGATRL